jgi:5'-3' exonuclease
MRPPVRLHLVDGTYELFRAHYSPRPGHTAPGGTDRKATVGVVASLIQLLHDPAEAVTHLAVAFDNPIVSFRNRLFAGYKTDEGVPPELREQFDTVEEAVRALGVAVWSMRDHEADDALATGAARFGAEVEQVRLMTPDKDLGQCIRGKHVVMVDRLRSREIDEDGLRARRGVGPRSNPDQLALTGDDADGNPGQPGFGEKSAAVLLGRYDHLERIPDAPHKWEVRPRGAETLAATLTARRADALLYRELATLVTDAPVAASLEEIRFRGVPRRDFERWCEALGVTALRDRPQRWA